MNRLYRLIWNHSKYCWQVASERARGHVSQGGSNGVYGVVIADSITLDVHPLKTLTSLCLMALAGLSSAAYAAPTGGTVTTGTAGISQTGNTTTIQQNSQNVTINWNSFSSAANEAIVFNQPNSSAIALNRVTGSESSSLLGSLTANGQIFIINPNGILFGAGAQVNVGGLVASTLNLSDDDFNKNNSNGNNSGHYTFSNNNNTGRIANKGNITTSIGGYVAMLGKQVSNQGRIITPEGTTLLAAGNNVSLNLNNGSLLGYSVNQGTLNALAENKQLIRANGGRVILTAQAANDITTATVNNTGIIEAKSLANKNGSILLLADMETGTVNVGGTLDASAPNGGNGGFIETSAAHVKVADGVRVTTKAENGHTGTWLIDPVDFTIAATGGDITGATLSTQLASNNVIIDSINGSTGTNGDVNVKDAITWAANNTLTLNAFRNININAPITAIGTNAGLVLNYGNYAVNGIAAGGTDYYVNAPVTLSGSAATLRINGNAYTLIHNMTDFANITSNPSGYYAVAENLTASGTYSDAVVANLGGVLSGFGHTLSGLSISSSANYKGLFAYNNGTIRDFGVVNGSVSGLAITGGLVGQNNGVIRGSFYTGSVGSGGYNGLGGLVGENRGSIRDSYFSGNLINNGAFSGGLVGTNNNGGTIANSYAMANMSFTPNYSGGLVGAIDSGSISNSRAYSRIVGQYWGGSLSGNVVLDATQMLQASNFSGWDMATNGGSDAVWRIYDGVTAPLLRSFLMPTTVTANSTTSNYNGSTFSGGSGVTYSDAGATLLGSVSYGGTSQGARNAGAYTIKVNGLYSDQLGYDIEQVDGALTINQATLTLSAVTDNKTYDGTIDSSGIVGSSGLQAGDTLTAVSQTYNSKNAGNRTLNVATYTVNDGNNGNNYNVVTYSASGSIYQKTIHVSSADIADKVYDGTRDAVINSLTVDGLIAGDDVTTTAEASFDTKNVGVNKDVRVSGITLAGDDRLNYWMATEFLDTSGSISQANITLSTSDISKTYDGTTTASGSATVTAGTLFTGDSLSGGSYAYTNKNAGSAKTVTVNGITIDDGNGGNNYNVTYANNTNSRISQATLTLSAVTDNKTYDGTIDSSGIVGSSGLQAGDTLTAVSQTYNSKNAGNRTLNVATYTVNDGNNGNNYNVVTNSASGSIYQKTIQVSSADIAGKVYDGTRDAVINSLTVDGLIAGDDVTTTAEASFDTKNVGVNKNVRVSGITLAGDASSNYWMATEFLDTTANITAVAIPPTVANTPTVANNPTYDTSVYQGILQSGVGARFGEQPVLPGSSGSNAPIQHLALNADASNQVRQGQAITERIAGLGCVVQMPEDAPIESCTVMSRAQ